PLTSLSPPVPPSTTSFPTRRSSDLRAYRNNPDTFQDNVLWRFMRNSLDSGVFKSQQAQWDKIDLPMWAVGNWSGMGLHLRGATEDRKSTRLNSSHEWISYAVFCLKK